MIRKDGRIDAALPIDLPLDFENAWPRVRADWLSEPYEPMSWAVTELADGHANEWFESLRTSLSAPGFRPAPPLSHPGFEAKLTLRFTRPIYLEPDDALVFTACVGGLLPAMLESGLNHEALSGPAFVSDSAGGQWPTAVRTWFAAFDARTREFVDRGYSVVAITDVSNFFGAARHDILERVLREARCPDDYVALLMRLLGSWFPSGRGLPWSTASHVLAAAYLLPIDRQLDERGITFVRLVDDYRVFCSTQAEAEAHIRFIVDKLRAIGLSPNGRKTRVVNSEALLAYPSSLWLRRKASLGLVRLIGLADRAGLELPANLGRRLAFSVMRTGDRQYLARLLMDLPGVDSILQALVEGRIPAMYLKILLARLRQQPYKTADAGTVRFLRNVALSTSLPVNRRSMARSLLLLLLETAGLPAGEVGHREGLCLTGSREAGEWRRLESLLFARVVSAGRPPALATGGAPDGFLSARALEMLLSSSGPE